MVASGDSAEVVRVLLLVQAAAGLLASVGELLLMGSPLYAVFPIVKAAVLVVLANRIVRRRRRALTVTIVVQCLGLLGVWFGVLLGLLPGLAPSITLVGLLTGVALPVAVIVLCARLVAQRPPAPPAFAANAGVWRVPGSPDSPYAGVWRSEDQGERAGVGVAR